MLFDNTSFTWISLIVKKKSMKSSVHQSKKNNIYLHLQSQCLLKLCVFWNPWKIGAFDMKPLCIYNVNAKINILWHPIPKTCVSQKIKVSYGIQFPKSCAIFFSPSSFWWCWWLGIWKQSTGKALTVLLNKLMLNSRQPTTKNLWSSKTVTLDVVFRKFTQISATLEWEPRQIFGAGSTAICFWYTVLLSMENLKLSSWDLDMKVTLAHAVRLTWILLWVTLEQHMHS